MGDLLSALLDGELEPASAEVAREHIAACPACEAELAATTATREVLRRLPSLDAPEGMIRQFRRRESMQRSLSWLAASAAAVAVFAFVASPQPDGATAPFRFAGLAPSPTPVGFETVAVEDESAFDPPYRAPRHLARGYDLVGVYERESVIQLVFSDGRTTLSVFELAGELDDAPPTGLATTVRMRDGSEAWAGEWLGGQLVVWQAGPVVYAVHADAPLEDVVAVAASLPEPRSLSGGQRLLRGARDLIDAISGRH
jgi:anti-sigma factor RsiW